MIDNNPERPVVSKAQWSWTAALSLSIGVAVIAYFLSYLSFIEVLDWQLYDLKFQIRGPQSLENTEVALVLIDQKTAEKLSFPFDRKIYAQLIEELDKLGASLIVFDIDFSSVGSIPSSDSLFYEAISSRANVILAGKIDYVYHHGIKHPITQVARPSFTVAPYDIKFGLVNDLVDPDGVSRRYPMYLTSRDTAYFSLALKTLAVKNEWDNPTLDISNGYLNIITDDVKSIPLFGIPSTLLNYYGPAGSFPSYSFIDVISGVYDVSDYWGELSEEEIELLEMMGTRDLFEDLLSESPFHNKIVLIGASAEDLQDNKFTPFHSLRYPLKTPGVEVHANALQMFMDDIYLKTLSEWWIRLGVLFLAVVFFVFGRTFSTWVGLLASVLVVGLIFVVSLMLFVHKGLWLRDVPLMLTVSIGYPANLLYSIILSQREKAQIRGMFGHYVPPLLVDALIKNPDMLNLGGELRRLTILFTDVAGFTSISETQSPKDLVTLLNDYLTPMTRIIKSHSGTIDKYEGDLIMAEFGAPVWFEDHAVKCCRAALEMQAKLKELRKVWKEEGRPELHSRIGINTGEVIAGNMGSEDVFDYTVMGDAVNLSSRLEGANKVYGTSIMIGNETWLDVKDHFVTRFLDLLRVKGKLEPVKVYELIAENEEQLSPEKVKSLKLFEEGIALFKERAFEEALKCFKNALELDNQDEPSRIYVERCELLIAEPPSDDWDGVFVLTEK